MPYPPGSDTDCHLVTSHTLRPDTSCDDRQESLRPAGGTSQKILGVRSYRCLNTKDSV